MTADIFRYKGHYSPETQKNRAIRFIQSYTDSVAKNEFIANSPTRYYGPSCIFFDTTNVQYDGAVAIKAWMEKLFSPFDKLWAEGISFLVIDESRNPEAEFKYTVNAEYLMSYWFKGDPAPIAVPRLFVFSIGDSETDDGFDGLQFKDVKLYWDTNLIKTEARRRAEVKKVEMGKNSVS